MWWNVGPHLQRRQRTESGFGEANIGPCQRRRSNSFFEANSDVEELIELLKRKYINVCRAWRVALDTDESGVLDFREFARCMGSIGYVGNIRTLWFNLDDDQSGTISLKELDPAAYYALEKFRVMAGRKFGGMLNCWHQLLDKDKSGTVSLEEFQEHLPELGYDNENEVAELFSYLPTTPGVRFVTIHDVKFLQNWEENKQATFYRSRLPKAWVNKDPYMTPSKGSLMSGGVMSANPSASTLDTVSGWLGQPMEDYGSIVAVDADKQKAEFLAFLKEKFGSLCKAFDAMDANGSGSLSMVEFQSMVVSVLRYCRPAEGCRLFLNFNADPDGVMTWDELGIPKHEWVQHILERRNRRLQRELAQGGADGTIRMLGSSPRQVKSYGGHMDRLRSRGQKRADVAFGTPLPKGWGFPPYFEPPHAHAGIKLPPLSAR